MVVAGEPWMIPALSRIWEECFGDSPEYIRFFMERRFPTCQSFVWLEQGEAVGAIYLLPCFLKGEPVIYAYAGGVLPEYRNKGIFSKILESSIEFVKAENAVLVLVPAVGTEQFYWKRGFRPAFSFCLLKCDCEGEILPVVFKNTSAKQYKQLRERAFQGLCYLQWDEKAVEYAIEENQFCGGFAQSIIFDREYLLFGKKIANKLEILETTLDYKVAKQLSATLCHHWNVEQVLFRLPSILDEETQQNGYIFGKQLCQNGWLGLNLL